MLNKPIGWTKRKATAMTEVVSTIAYKRVDFLILGQFNHYRPGLESYIVMTPFFLEKTSVQNLTH